jgi:hypothetical protein
MLHLQIKRSLSEERLPVLNYLEEVTGSLASWLSVASLVLVVVYGIPRTNGELRKLSKTEGYSARIKVATLPVALAAAKVIEIMNLPKRVQLAKGQKVLTLDMDARKISESKKNIPVSTRAR